MQSVPQQLQIQEIKVKLFLAGGHQHIISLKSDDPLLQNLLMAIVAHSQKPEVGFSGLFQIPIDEGRGALCFASEHLVGIVTKPPIFVRSTEETTSEQADVLPSDVA